jgi:hypothetical protein
MTTEKIELNVTPAFAANLRAVAGIFQTSDLGGVLEHMTRHVFEDIVKGENLRDEIQSWPFKDHGEIDAVLAAASEIDPWLGTAPHTVEAHEGALAVDYGDQ